MKINEIFKSIQGEGMHAGELTIFVRVSGCNLSCSFCDTKHNTGEEMSVNEIIERIVLLANGHTNMPVTFTGGEPLMHDETLEVLHKLIYSEGYMQLRVETNGSYKLNRYRHLGPFVSITCSPKTSKIEDLQIESIDCLKLLCPYISGNVTPENLMKHPGISEETQCFLQPVSLNNAEIDKASLEVVISELERLNAESNDHWKLSAQVHKYLNIR